MISTSLLRAISLFAPLTPETLDWLSQQCYMRKFDKQATVVSKGDTTSDLMFLLQGQLMVYDVAGNGQEVGLHILQAGECFGELSVIDGLPRAAALRTTQPSVVGYMSRGTFYTLMEKEPLVSRFIMQRFAQVIRANNQNRVILSINNVGRRVVALLLNYATRNANAPWVINQLPSQQALATMANTTRESVSRALNALVERGLITKDGKVLLITDPPALEKFVAEGVE